MRSVLVAIFIVIWLFVGTVFAQDRHMVVEGLFKDDVGVVLEGQFQVMVLFYVVKVNEGNGVVVFYNSYWSFFVSCSRSILMSTVL